MIEGWTWTNSEGSTHSCDNNFEKIGDLLNFKKEFY